MYPILLSLGPVKLYSFGLFLFLAVLMGSFIVWREGRDQKFDEEKIIDFLITLGIFGLIGARAYYLITHFNDFGFSIFRYILIFHFPGLSFMGAIFGGLLGIFVFVRKQKWSFWEICDITVLGLAIGEAIGRIGAFFSGTAYGIVTKLPIGVNMVGLLGKRQPVQIYEALVSFIIFLILLKLKSIFKIKNLPSGLLFLTYFILLGLSKFWLEFLRGDSVYFLGWRLTQIVSLILIIFSTVFVYIRLGRSLRNDLSSLIRLKMIKKGDINV